MRQVLTRKNIAMVIAKLPEEEKEKVKLDDYKDKIVKFIPAEVVALYVTVYGIASAAQDQIPFEVITWIIFAVGILGTILHLWRIAEVSDWTQILISTGAFVVWVFALGGPFLQLPWYHSVYGAILLPIYTFFAPIIASK